MADTKLIYDRQTVVDIGVPVVTYNDDPRYSFYHQAGKPRFNRPAQDRKTTVNQVILHHDGMKTSAGCFRVLRDRRLSTHLMIDHDGVVYQSLALRDTAWHAYDRNETSIGIDLNNPVHPDRLPGNQAPREIFRGRINSGRVKVSLGYTDAQYDALIAVLDGLFRIFPQLQQHRRAPIGTDGKVVRRKLVETSYAGVLGHFHVSANKWDPGPGFDWERVLIGIRGNRLHFPVTLKGTRNLAQVSKVHALEAAEAYFQNTEQGNTGGHFPVGLNQAWHTGAHLNLKAGTPIYAPADGLVMAARNLESEAQGSTNLVVIGHSMKIGSSERTFYSVLQHVQQEALGTGSNIPWIKRFAEMEGPIGLPDDARDPKAAPGHIALENGRVALGKVPVKAGELVGHVGTFNPSLTRGSPVGLLDFATIAASPLLPSNDPTFEMVSDDADNSLLCTSRAVWKRVTQERDALRGLIEGSYPLDPTEIRAFYSRNPNAKAMRWLAVRHPTEYSKETDFSFVYGPRLDFEWSARQAAKQQLKKVRKFLWWDDVLAKHLGFNKEGLVWAYHPIALLSVLAMGEARRALEVDEDGGVRSYSDTDLAKEKTKDRQTEEAFALATEGSAHRHDDHNVKDNGAARDIDAEAERAPTKGGWLRWEQGEWTPED
jgi:N-acetyl-anhydromuramyl-L-alanine amidase AmpD